jgi:hypothetical protein
MKGWIKRLGLYAAVLAGIAFCTAPAAKAGTVIDLITFSVGGFGPGAPVSPVTGSIGLIFDPLLDYTESTTGIAVFTPLNINLGSPLGFTYRAGIQDGTLTIGGTQTSVQGVAEGTNDFLLQIGSFRTSPIVMEFFYSQVGKETYFTNFSPATVHVQQLAPAVVAATPIPGSLLLLTTALLGFAGFAFRRRRSAQALPSPC